MISFKTSHRYLDYKVCPKWTHYCPPPHHTPSFCCFVTICFIIISVTQVRKLEVTFPLPPQTHFCLINSCLLLYPVLAVLIFVTNCIRSLLNDLSSRLSTLVCLPYHHYKYLINTNLILWVPLLIHLVKPRLFSPFTIWHQHWRLTTPTVCPGFLYFLLFLKHNLLFQTPMCLCSPSVCNCLPWTLSSTANSKVTSSEVCLILS